MSWFPASEEELGRQVAFALEDESFHPLDEVQDRVAPEFRSFSDLESNISDWSFAYGVAWMMARMRNPLASSTRVASIARRIADEAWNTHARNVSWNDLITEDRAGRGQLRPDPETQLEEFSRNLGEMRIRRPENVGR